MSPEFKEKDSQNEQLFGTYSTAQDSESSRWLWRILIIGVSAALCIVAGILVAERLWRKGPYDEMVGRLQPRMRSEEVVQALGSPYDKEGGICSIGRMGWEDCWLYKADGTDLPLVIEFDHLESHYALQWCVYVPGGDGGIVTALKEIDGRPGYEFRFARMRLDCHKIE